MRVMVDTNVLVSAILLDSNLLAVDVETPEIVTPRTFLEQYS